MAIEVDLPDSKGIFTGRWFRALRGFSIEHLWALITLAGIFIFLSTHPIRPHDFWWHAKVGEVIATTGRIPLADTFSYTVPGNPYLSYQTYWLMELMLFRVYSIGGSALVVFVHSLIITGAYVLLLWLCLRLSGSWRVAALCTLFAAALGLNDWNVRPQAIAPLLAVVLLWVTYVVRSARKAQGAPRMGLRWLVPVFVSMLAWVNSHGSFVIGLLLLGIWLCDGFWQIVKARLAGEGWGQTKHLREPCLALLVAVIACLINPRGIGVVAYLGSMGGNPVVQNLVPEWTPSSFDTLHGSFFLIGLLLSATVLALSSQQPTFFQMVTFLVFAALGLKTLRGVMWFGIVMAPVLADHWTSLAEQIEDIVKFPAGSRSQSQSLLLNYVLVGLVLLGVIVSLPWFKDQHGFLGEKSGLLSSETPVEATRFMLEAGLPAQVFHDMSFGSYLIWAAHPEYPVFVDPRIELYPADVWRDYLELSAAKGDWKVTLDEYGINTLMLSLDTQRPLVEAARESPHWQLVYEEKPLALFVRED